MCSSLISLRLEPRLLRIFCQKLRGVDELHDALAVVGLAVGEHPDVGGDAGVVEHVGGQRDDGLDQVVLQHVAADLGLAGAGAAGEQRRAVEHDADAAAAVLGRAHLAEQVQQEQQRAVRHARQAGAEAAAVALLLVLVADGLLDLLPLHAEGRVGQHVVEQLAEQAVVGQRVAEHDVADVLAADQHVGLADGVATRG